MLDCPPLLSQNIMLSRYLLREIYFGIGKVGEGGISPLSTALECPVVNGPLPAPIRIGVWVKEWDGILPQRHSDQPQVLNALWSIAPHLSSPPFSRFKGCRGRGGHFTTASNRPMVDSPSPFLFNTCILLFTTWETSIFWIGRGGWTFQGVRGILPQFIMPCGGLSPPPLSLI